MQGRYRNTNEGRGYNANPNNRNFSRNNNGSFSGRPYLPPPPPRKEEIFRKAGRLAAEYLVSQGLLPPSSLQPKWQNGRYQDFKGQDRESPITDSPRNSVLNRLGNPNSDTGIGRRRYTDEFNDPRNDFRGKRRVGPYGREYGSDWTRENGRSVGRNREYNDMENEGDFCPEFYRDRRSGFDQLPSRSENTMESGSDTHDVVDDTGSKVSSSSMRRDAVCEVDGDFNKSVAGDEVKSDASGDLKRKNVEEQVDVQPCENEGESKSGDDLMKSCAAEDVPTKPRSSSSAQKSPNMEQGLNVESNNITEVSYEEPKVTMGEDSFGVSAKNSPTNQIETEPQAPEHTDQKHGANQSSPALGSLKPVNDEAQDTDKREGLKRQRDSSSEDVFSHMHNVKAKQLSLEVELTPVEEEKVAPTYEGNAAPIAIEHEKLPGEDSFIPKVEPGLDNKMEEEMQLLPPSFKICDLNLMHAPEITEIHDDPEPPRHGKELAVDFGLSIGNNSNGAGEASRLSHDDDKVVQVIDLEDDSTADAGASDPSKPNDEPIYPNLDCFLNQPEHADLPGIQDGYSPEFSDFLGSHIPRCPSVPSDLNNLQGLHDAEGVPNDDDAIYVSLGEIPIGFMEVWDPPPQEYGKFF